MTASLFSAPRSTSVLISLVILLNMGVIVFAAPTCSTEKHLNDCGYFGVTEDECVADGCCYNPSVPAESPWCFYKNDGYKYFSTTAARIDCAYWGVSFFECRSFGCYFSPKFNEPWCFYPNTNIDPALCPEDRVECGYYGITQDDCEAKDCCWSPLGDGSEAPWCFHSLISSPSTEPAAESSPDTGAGVGVKERAEPPSEEAVGVHPEETFGTLPPVSAPAPQATAQEGVAEVTSFSFDEVFEEAFGESPPAAEGSSTSSSVATAPVPELLPALDTPAAEAPSQSTSLRADARNERLVDETLLAMELSKEADAQELIELREAFNSATSLNQPCGAAMTTEYECLSIRGCFWENTNGDARCLKHITEPGSRSLGKFWKPQTIY